MMASFSLHAKASEKLISTTYTVKGKTYVPYRNLSSYSEIGIASLYGYESGNITASGTIRAGAITYPSTHGTNGQVLTTSGSGTLTWTTSSSGLVREVANELTATTNQTSFTLTQTPSANSRVKMFINGVRISNTAYSVSGTTVTYIPANNGNNSLSSGDRIQFDYYY